MDSRYLENLLAVAGSGAALEPADIRGLLALKDQRQIQAVLAAARETRRVWFGNRIFLYGFVYFDTYCRNDCLFCYYRRSNTLSPRYRQNTGQILEAAGRLAESGVHLIDLTMGEDPAWHRDENPEMNPLTDLVRAVRQAVDRPVMVSPGLVSPAALKNLAEAGADWYACYQETHNRSLFAKLRPGQDYDHRLHLKKTAKASGLLIEEGLLAGVGETVADVAESMGIMADLQADQVRVMSFVPQPGTPMAARPLPDRWRELLTIAAMRLVLPDRLIPASLDVDGLAGLKQRLQAGANVVTSLVPPNLGLAGVSRSTLDVDNARRTTTGVLPILEELGLEPASQSDYQAWMAVRRKTTTSPPLALRAPSAI